MRGNDQIAQCNLRRLRALRESVRFPRRRACSVSDAGSSQQVTQGMRSDWTGVLKRKCRSMQVHAGAPPGPFLHYPPPPPQNQSVTNSTCPTAKDRDGCGNRGEIGGGCTVSFRKGTGCVSTLWRTEVGGQQGAPSSSASSVPALCLLPCLPLGVARGKPSRPLPLRSADGSEGAWPQGVTTMRSSASFDWSKQSGIQHKMAALVPVRKRRFVHLNLPPVPSRVKLPHLQEP